MGRELIKSVQYFFKSIFYHTPKEKLNKSEIDKIKQSGLIHFCNSRNVNSIVKEGVKGGLKAPMKKIEKNYTWYYINEEQNFEKNKRIVQGKGERKNYDMCIIIKKLTEEQLEELRIRRKLDDAVIYPGTLKTDDMKAQSIPPL